MNKYQLSSTEPAVLRIQNTYAGIWSDDWMRRHFSRLPIRNYCSDGMNSNLSRLKFSFRHICGLPFAGLPVCGSLHSQLPRVHGPSGGGLAGGEVGSLGAFSQRARLPGPRSLSASFPQLLCLLGPRLSPAPVPQQCP